MAKTPYKSPLSSKDVEGVGRALQGALVDLVDLSLVAKQAHWNVVGTNFRSLHLQLDEVVLLARNQADLVAERAMTIGVNPDGRAATVAKESGLPGHPEGTVKDADVVAYFVAALEATISRMRQRIAATEVPDPVTQDLLIGATAELEKTYWMFQAER
jgi:starvation-inducible DNA-binding protein